MLRSLPGWLLENFWLLKNSYLSSLETVLFFSDWIKLFKNCLIFIYLCLSLFVRIEAFNYPLLYCHGGKSEGCTWTKRLSQIPGVPVIFLNDSPSILSFFTYMYIISHVKYGLTSTVWVYTRPVPAHGRLNPHYEIGGCGGIMSYIQLQICLHLMVTSVTVVTKSMTRNNL